MLFSLRSRTWKKRLAARLLSGCGPWANAPAPRNAMEMRRLNRWQKTVFSLALFLAVAAVHGQTIGHEFINFDDPLYVTDNPVVLDGLTSSGVWWALFSFHAHNWHPLTWISHMLDSGIWGQNPEGHHATNVLLHAANALFLFFLLLRFSGAPVKCFLTALLFAVHPQHVESVAWVAERKDLLSTFFTLAACHAYGSYVHKPLPRRYLSVVLLFGMALLSKPMAVTFPLVLLLLDYWPLGRYTRPGALKALALEKGPLFGMSAILSAVTLLAQSHSAIVSIKALGFSARLGNALVSYIKYAAMALWPSDLSVFYPHPGEPPAWMSAGAALLLAGVVFTAYRLRFRAPWFPVGLLIYLGTLVPVIGIVQVGLQGMADRYTYLPSTALFAMAVWGLAALFDRLRLGKAPRAALASVILLYAAAGYVQAGYWKNSKTLFERSVEIAPLNYLAHFNLGLDHYNHGRPLEAIRHYRQSLAVKPGDPLVNGGLGSVLVARANASKKFREVVP
jgi:hypothetical protein